jgi:hypothetical protein
MSHSQFHSTNLFILRHAWLNLWDKHMTTGRINQVTTFRSAFAAIIYSCAWQARTLSWCGVHHLFICWRSIAAQGCLPPNEREYKPPWTHKWHHLVSHSHTSQARSPCPIKRTKVTRLRWGLPTINDTWKAYIDAADPQVATASGLTIGKQSTSFRHCSSLSHKDSLRLQRWSQATKAPTTTKASPLLS